MKTAIGSQNIKELVRIIMRIVHWGRAFADDHCNNQEFLKGLKSGNQRKQGYRENSGSMK
jgi:hypothetical protein